MFCGPLDCGGNILLIGCFTPAHLLRDPNSCQLSLGSEKEKALPQVQAGARAVLPLGPYDPVDPTVLEGSAAGRDAVWSPWQAVRGGSQHSAPGILQQSPAILRS